MEKVESTLFEGLTDDEYARMTECFKTTLRAHRKGEEVAIPQGRVGVVHRGRISVMRTDADGGFTVALDFPRQSVDRVRLSEDTTKSQRVEAFEIYANGQRVFRGTVIGFSRIAIFDRPVTTDRLEVRITRCRNEPYIDRAEVCATGAYRPW